MKNAAHYCALFYGRIYILWRIFNKKEEILCSLFAYQKGNISLHLPDLLALSSPCSCLVPHCRLTPPAPHSPISDSPLALPLLPVPIHPNLIGAWVTSSSGCTAQRNGFQYLEKYLWFFFLPKTALRSENRFSNSFSPSGNSCSCHTRTSLWPATPTFPPQISRQH